MLPHETLKRALATRAGFETIEEQVGDARIRFFGRVRPQNMPTWLAVMRDILIASSQSQWTADLSRQYFLRGDKVFFGWRIIIQGPEVQQHLNHVSQVVSATKTPASQQLDEVSLHAPPNRNALRNGKGAQSSLTAVVGPMAKAQMGI
jgi:hypothetical protein